MLSISNLSLTIGDAHILNSVSLEIKVGEKVGIIGPNGSGKTTLFNCLSGFHFPTSGKIIFKDKDITTAAAYRRATLGLGRVFQNFGIFREMTVLENMITAIESKQPLMFFPWGSRHKKNVQEAMLHLEMVKLDGKALNKAGSLSGGQMRLLEITRALAFGADLLLLDEPTAGVSPKMKLEIQEVLRKLQELKKTIIVIEHDMQFIQNLCDRIIVLDQGSAVLDGTPSEVRANPQLQDIYFGTSATDHHA